MGVIIHSEAQRGCGRVQSHTGEGGEPGVELTSDPEARSCDHVIPQLNALCLTLAAERMHLFAQNRSSQ